MKLEVKRKLSLALVISTVAIYILAEGNSINLAFNDNNNQTKFDQAAALAKLRESIKGKEKDPAETVFKNIQLLKGVPAGNLLRIMELGYSRSLGVDCTHCHTPDQWEKEDKTQKQTARDMAGMMKTINTDLLKNIKNLGANPIVNCTTCHRGDTKPALNLPLPSPSPGAAKSPASPLANSPIKN